MKSNLYYSHQSHETIFSPKWFTILIPLFSFIMFFTSSAYPESLQNEVISFRDSQMVYANAFLFYAGMSKCLIFFTAVLGAIVTGVQFINKSKLASGIIGILIAVFSSAKIFLPSDAKTLEKHGTAIAVALVELEPFKYQDNSDPQVNQSFIDTKMKILAQIRKSFQECPIPINFDSDHKKNVTHAKNHSSFHFADLLVPPLNAQNLGEYFKLVDSSSMVIPLFSNPNGYDTVNNIEIGSVVKILSHDSVNRDWFKISSNGLSGWLQSSSLGLKITDTETTVINLQDGYVRLRGKSIPIPNKFYTNEEYNFLNVPGEGHNQILDSSEILATSSAQDNFNSFFFDYLKNSIRSNFISDSINKNIAATTVKALFPLMNSNLKLFDKFDDEYYYLSFYKIDKQILIGTYFDVLKNYNVSIDSTNFINYINSKAFTQDTLYSFN